MDDKKKQLGNGLEALFDDITISCDDDENMNNLKVINSLKYYLKKNGIKQSWLADKVGVHRGTMNNIINNKYNTSLEIALKISRVLNMSVEDIFLLTNDDFKDENDYD